MNILVTGANGQLGRELRNASQGSGHRFIFSDVSSVPGLDTLYLDITNRDAVSIVCESESIDVIVNCVAYTDVEKAEDDISFAETLNHFGPETLAAVAASRGATLVHISTDYVFGGDACTPYREDDPVSPLGVYGATKLQGEKAVLDSPCKSIIIRTAWLYSPYGKNFVKTVLRLSAEGRDMRCVFDQVGSPTYAADLAALIVSIIDGGMLGRTGVYHFTDEGAVSWYDFAKAVARLSGSSMKISPCRTEEFPTKAARPHYSVLDKAKVKHTFGITIPYWQDSLEDCLKRMQ